MSLINKPLVVEKFKSFHSYVKNNGGKIGTKQRGIDLNLNNACNLRCEHCFTNSSKGENVKETLPLDVVARVANEAHDLGIFECCPLKIIDLPNFEFFAEVSIHPTLYCQLLLFFRVSIVFFRFLVLILSWRIYSELIEINLNLQLYIIPVRPMPPIE